MSALDAQLLGPPRFSWEGEPVQPSGTKGRALLTYLCAVGRPVPRGDLAELFWGDGRLRNLRQELYVLRQLAGADQWLEVDKDTARVAARTDLDAVRRGTLDPAAPRRGPFGDGLDGCATDALDEWLASTRRLAERTVRDATLHSVHARMGAGDVEGARALLAPLLEGDEPSDEALQAAVALGLRRPVRDDEAPLSRTAQRVLRLAVLDPQPLEVDLVVEVLDLSVLAVAEAYQELEESGRLVDGIPVPAVRAEVRAGLAPQTADGLHQALADALVRRRAPADRLARHRRFAPVTPAATEVERVRRWVEQLGGADPLAEVAASEDPTHRLRALNALGVVAATSGDLEQARRLHQTALELARSLEHLPAVLRLHNSLGADAQRAGELDAARDHFAEALAMAERIDDAPARGAILFNLANVELFSGRPGAARAPTRALLELGVADGRMRALGYRVRAILELAVGRFGEAAGWSARAAEAFELTGDAANSATSRFNGALGRTLAAGASADLTELREQAHALAASGRVDLAQSAAQELACCERDPDRIRAALAGLPEDDGTRAVMLRLALLEGASVEAVELPPQADRWTPWLLALVAAHHPDRRAKCEARIDQLVGDGSEGLLPSQSTAWRARVRRWLDDPRRW